MRMELFESGLVYVVRDGASLRFVQHIGVFVGTPIVVVLDVVRDVVDDVPFPEELDDVVAVTVGGALLAFAIDGGLDARQSLYELPVRHGDTAGLAPSIVRFADLAARLARELAPARGVPAAAGAPSTAPTLIDDDGVLVIACGATFASADDFSMPDTLLAGRAAGRLVFCDSGDAGTLHIEESDTREGARFLGVLDGDGPWWVMPLSQFTLGGTPVNAVRLSSVSGRRAVYATRRGATVQIARVAEVADALADDEVPAL